MALRELKKPVNQTAPNIRNNNEKKAAQFIAQGSKFSADHTTNTDDHRLTLRIPKWLLDKVDVQRKERVGSISRNLWILEVIEKATQ